MAKQSQKRQMNAPVFLLHPGKQVTPGCNKEITQKKKNLLNVQITKTSMTIQTSRCTE